MIKILIGGSPCTYWSVAQKKGREVEADGLGWELGKRFEHTAEQEAETPESTNQTTDLSDAPEEIKEQIIENDRALKERDAPEPATLPEGFDVVDQLAELLAERKKLHIIDEENLRYNCDIIALEYAIGALRR